MTYGQYDSPRSRLKKRQRNQFDSNFDSTVSESRQSVTVPTMGLYRRHTSSFGKSCKMLKIAYLVGVLLVARCAVAFRSPSAISKGLGRSELIIKDDSLRRHSDLNEAICPVRTSRIEASLYLSERINQYTQSVENRARRTLRSAAAQTRTITTNLPYFATTSVSQAKAVAKTYWWTSPLVLCLIPLYAEIALQTKAHFPVWWKMVDMTYIFESSNAHSVVLCFLASNVSYLFSGLYLLRRFPPRKFPAARMASVFSWTTSRYTWLSFWVLAAGFISTIFHSVQALGDYHVAEALCFLDHGIAIAAVGYFWNVCGRPSRAVWLLGGTGMLCLSCPIRPGYAWLHSAWHILSAAAAVAWGRQSKTAPHRAQVERTMVHR